jgi:hypothetical protein
MSYTNVSQARQRMTEVILSETQEPLPSDINVNLDLSGEIQSDVLFQENTWIIA